MNEVASKTCKLPEKFDKISIGIDVAYTKKTNSDYSCAVVLGHSRLGDNFFVLDVVRVQVQVLAFGNLLKNLRQEWGSPPIYWFVGGQEKIVAEYLLNVVKVPIKTLPAKEDKFARAQAVAQAWNSGRIWIPSANKPWLAQFTAEILSFSGMDDPHDDQVDALAAAYIPFAAKRGFRGDLTKQILSF